MASGYLLDQHMDVKIYLKPLSRVRTPTRSKAMQLKEEVMAASGSKGGS